MTTLMMSATKSIFVGNLPMDTTEDQLHALFSEHGTVCSVTVIKDRLTGQPRGFGFIEMDEEEADYAIEQLNGIDFFGRNLHVVEPLSLSESHH